MVWLAGAVGPGRQVSEAREKLLEAEAERLLNSDEVVKEAVRAAEQDG